MSAALDESPLPPFAQDPVGFAERAFAAEGDVFFLPGRQLCVAEPTLARAVLANREGLYEEHSDFFHTRRGVFGPREVQARIGRESRALLRPFVRRELPALRAAVAALAPESSWPDTGNRLMYRHLVDGLVSAEGAPSGEPDVRALVGEVVERAVLAGARERYSSLRRWFFRRRVEHTLAAAILARRRPGRGAPEDVLGLLATAAPEAAPRDLAEVFLSFVFALAGSVGFVFAWSVYLLGSHPRSAAEPTWVVQEALRLWPIAWLLGRRPARAHEVAGHPVTPRDLVVVCPYLIHRHPRFWPSPAAFEPTRWALSPAPPAYLPFGWGAHACVAGGLTTELVAELLSALLAGASLEVDCLDTRPQVSAALAPPRFTLRRVPSVPRTATKGGEEPWPS